MGSIPSRATNKIEKKMEENKTIELEDIDLEDFDIKQLFVSEMMSQEELDAMFSALDDIDENGIASE